MNTAEVAKRAGVSIGTVSNVVNGKSSVGEEIRARVQRAIQELGWTPSPLARGLRRPSALIVMFLPDITNPFFAAVVRGAEDAASKRKHRIVLCNTDNNPDRELDLFAELSGFNPAGYLLIPSAASRLEQVLGKSARPRVCVDRCPDDWRGDFITSDNEGGAREAAAYLVARGHRHVAVITGPLQSQVARARLKGFEEGLRENGVDLPAEFVFESTFDRNGGVAATKHLLELLPRPTAVFASNDMIASGVLLSIRQAGLRCPQDVSVIGFDNVEYAELTEPGLTTIHQPAYQLGARAVQTLFHRMDHPASAPEVVRLPTQLRIRASVLAVPRRMTKTKTVPAKKKAQATARKSRVAAKRST